MSPVSGSVSERETSTRGNELSRRPPATGCGVPSGETSDNTAQMPVSGAVPASCTSRLAGPADRTSWGNGAGGEESPSGSARLISVVTGKALASPLNPALPTIAVLGGSVFDGREE